ncbi:hypothetical protein V8E54_007422 [Elaphomyces granulatus]
MSAKGHLQLQREQSDDEECQQVCNKSAFFDNLKLTLTDSISHGNYAAAASLPPCLHRTATAPNKGSFAAKAIQSFRNYLRGIPFRYHDVILTPLGRQLKKEGDVRLFFDSSIVLAVWPVALAMPPTIRAADLILTSEELYDSSRPDMSVLAYSGPAAGQPTAVAQIEIKGPQGLAAFRPVIQSVLDHRAIEVPADWIVVTRQLRKYAQDTLCRTVLCSDGFDTYVFIFPPDESEETIYFIWSWSDSASSPLTLREAVLFSIWSGIKLNAPFELRDYSANTRVIRNAGDYQDIFGPMPEVEREIPSCIQPPRESTHRIQAGNLIMVTTDLGNMYQLKETYGQAKDYIGNLTVEEVFTKDVIKCSMGDVSNMVLKFFPNDSATMMTEIRAYEALMPLQGCVVPRFISVFSVEGHRGRAIALSVVEGINLRQHFKEEAPSIELFRSVLDQLQAVHNCGVAHMDVRDENIIIKPDRSVVFIDFGNSLVNPVKSELAFRIDRDMLAMAFIREGLDEQTTLIASGRVAKVNNNPEGSPFLKKEKKHFT